jgi:catechol 2,3-dioxygenase
VIQVSRVGHVVLNVRDLETSIAFYGDVLGLREIGRFGRQMAFFSATGENHHDLAVVELGPEARRPDEPAVGLCHVAFKIGDDLEQLRRAKAHLETHGVAIRRIENHRVSQSIYFADPDGNEIELYVDDDPTIWRTNPAAVATAEPFELSSPAGRSPPLSPSLS